MLQARGEGAVGNETVVERTSDLELVVTRMFNGPAHIVFDAWTRPELLKRWWAFGRDPNKPEVFSGRYIEVSPPSRLVLTQLYERMRNAGEAVVTVTFEENQGRTRLTLHQLFPSKAALEGAIASGMEHGMRETLDQLDALVAVLRR
jgi:uncharacterized protein YndB with AHSA1/START domain